ncbi:MAG: hypothetical protein V3R93_07070 [Candidatus Hydrothermarchaeaceae archaeon]
MGKFKFSKKAYLDKVKENRDWEGGKEVHRERPDINKTMHCHRFVSLDKEQRSTITVEIKAGECNSSYMCSVICNFR